MQEEVENRSINLAISMTRLTGRSVVAGIYKYLHHREAVKMQGGKGHGVHGKQTVKQLIGQNQGATNVELPQTGMKDFERLAKKYGVDYAIRKDKTSHPPRYFVFVRSKDADALDAICKEHAATVLQKKKPSVLKQLHHFMELAKSTPGKVVEKMQELGR